MNANFLLGLNDDYTYITVHTHGCCLVEDRYSFDAGTSPDEIGNTIVMPFSVRAAGILVAADYNIDGELILYDSNSNILRSVSVDKDLITSTLGQVQIQKFSSALRIEKNQIVRIAYKPATVGNPDTYLGKFGYDGDAQKMAYLNGLNWTYAVSTSRVDGGEWLDDAENLAAISLFYDEVYR